jgi:hypothetical protein
MIDLLSCADKQFLSLLSPLSLSLSLSPSPPVSPSYPIFPIAMLVLLLVVVGEQLDGGDHPAAAGAGTFHPSISTRHVCALAAHIGSEGNDATSHVKKRMQLGTWDQYVFGKA